MADGPDQATTIELLAEVWASIDGLVDELDEADWDLATDCPGWTVKDQLAHVAALEASMAGRPQLEHTPPDAPWIRNDFGRITEAGVDVRRSWEPPEVVAEFRDVIIERLAQLDALTADEWAADSWTPVGPGTYGLFILSRIVDCWAHEQDMRRATQRPGHLDGPAAEAVTERLLGGFPMVVGKRAGAPDGATVVLRLDGPLTREVAVVVDGRARLLDQAPADATTTITMGSETYAVLACGRQPAGARDDVRIEGDQALGQAVVDNLNIMV